MPRETMTPRERWVAVLQRRPPDRLPLDYWATAEATQRLLAHLGCDRDEMLRRLHIDTPFNVGGRYIGPSPRPGEDIWGIRYQAADYGTGAYQEVANAPLAGYDSVEDIERNYRWPSPDHWDYAHLAAETEGQQDRPIRGGGSEPFLLYKSLRGQELAFMDLIEHPDIVAYCLDKLFELAYQSTLRIFEAIPGRVLISYVAEDLGGQQGLMYSPAQIREVLLPRMRRMADLVRQHGSYVFHHSDGAIRDILPALIGIGIQVLNPIQWRLPGMAREGLKKDFGASLIFHGGVDNQETLPFGSVEDVRREVVDNIRILGAGGGYIPAPCHNIQANTPPENIVTLYETAYECSWTHA